jgi:hypothetical protein
MLAAVYPGDRATSSWAWLVVALWFGGLPVVLLTLAGVYKLLGKDPVEDEQQD